MSHSRPGQREERCSVRNLAGFLVDVLLIGTSQERNATYVHTIPFIEVSPTSFDRTAGMCDLFPGGQAGSATAELALSPIVCSQ
jgi:hypothetical protein